MNKPIKLIISLALAFSAAAIGSLATTSAIPTWYTTIDKPFFTPPNWLFGPVWTVLYATIGVSAFLIWIRKSISDIPKTYALYGIQLILNTLWSLVFFGLQQPWLGVIVIIALDIAVIATIVKFYAIQKFAGLLLIPYLLWILFATALTIGIAILN